MLNNLEAEMVRKGVSRQDIANTIEVSYNTVCCKMRGQNQFYFDEAKRIRDLHFPEMDLEYLFANSTYKENQDEQTAAELDPTG